VNRDDGEVGMILLSGLKRSMQYDRQKTAEPGGAKSGTASVGVRKGEQSLRLTDILDKESLYHWSSAFCRYFELLFSKDADRIAPQQRTI
jgi:hypothetical protein